MNRRGFLGGILAIAAAPAIVRADSLMRVVPRETTVWIGVDVGAVPGDIAILTPAAITREALRILHQQASFIEVINRPYPERLARTHQRSLTLYTQNW